MADLNQKKGKLNFQDREKFYTILLDQILIFVIAQLLLFFYLGSAFLFPQRYIYTFGGDGAFIYFNMIFHTLYGNGWTLNNMNYPVFESIFMTDAQAGLSILFNWINQLLPGILT